jgi:hypothetical protein
MGLLNDLTDSTIKASQIREQQKKKAAKEAKEAEK